jgi:hypothetical protein
MDDYRHPSRLGFHRLNRRRLVQAAGAGAVLHGAGTVRAFSQAATPVANATPEPTPPGIHTYPRHGTITASPGTEISFRGVSAEVLGDLRVSGSESGGHSGVMMPHHDGKGVSFVPDRSFGPGEEITVTADIPLGNGFSGDLVFGVSVPRLPSPPPAEREENSPLEPPHEFRSLPGLRPPVIEVLANTGQTAPGYVFFAPRIEGGQSGAMIVDNDGMPIWFHKPGIDMSEAMDFKVQMFRGEPVLVWWQGAKPLGYGVGHFVIANSAYEQIHLIQVANGFQGGDLHEVLITSRDTLLFPIYAPVIWDLTAFGGSATASVLDQVVQEVEIETGRVIFEWHSLDNIAIDESNQEIPDEPDSLYDYVHLNSIGEDPDGNLILSLRHTHGIVTIDRVTGDVLWRLNGTESDFEMGEGAEFRFQHDARSHGNGRITLLDNGTGSGESGIISRGLALDLDFDSMTATLAMEYPHPLDGTSENQANLQVLPNGNVFIGWGPSPHTTEMTADGELLWHCQFPEGGQSYRAYRFPWSGTPAARPDVAIEMGDAGSTTVYVSWNGATDVAGWQVVEGENENVLQPVTHVPRDGFETAIDVNLDLPWVAVQAIDTAGQVMATSEPVFIA